MRKVVAVLLLVTLLSVAAAAAGHWNGAGWYVIWDAGMDGGIEKNGGPYSTKEACEANLPPNDEDYIFYCEYHATQPEWDW